MHGDAYAPEFTQLVHLVYRFPVTKHLSAASRRHVRLIFVNHRGLKRSDETESEFRTCTGIFMFFRLALAVLLSGIVLSGCTAHRSWRKPAVSSRTASHPVAFRPLAPAASQYARPAAYATGDAPYALGSGDKVRITVFGQENLSRVYPVDAGGYISMPLIGAVMAGGGTTFQLEERITASLRQKYVKDPKVTVEVETYRPFFI